MQDGRPAPVSGGWWGRGCNPWPRNSITWEAAHATSGHVAGNGSPAGSWGVPSGQLSEGHLPTQLGCCDPQGAMSCGSPMPRGERIAKPAEWETPTWPVFCVLQAKQLQASGPLCPSHQVGLSEESCATPF